MDYKRLEDNIIDTIEEQQLKLGYLKETVRLYYPLTSLKRFLDMECDAKQMMLELEHFSRQTKEHLGGVKITHQGERFCIAIPPAGAEYIHEKLDTDSFLANFIRVIGRHDTKWEEILDIFHQYSHCVHVEAMNNGEFDYLLYFENGKPDSYRYCVSIEGEHVIYHRYTPADYEEFGF